MIAMDLLLLIWAYSTDQVVIEKFFNVNQKWSQLRKHHIYNCYKTLTELREERIKSRWVHMEQHSVDNPFDSGNDSFPRGHVISRGDIPDYVEHLSISLIHSEMKPDAWPKSLRTLTLAVYGIEDRIIEELLIGLPQTCRYVRLIING